LNVKTAIKTYTSIDQNLKGAYFEQRWFESVVMILQCIQDKRYSAEESHHKLMEITSSLQWIQENLNEKLDRNHRGLLKSIYSTNIQILNQAIQTMDYEYLNIVIESLKVCMAPYYRNKPADENLMENNL
jgi:predicted P-loop ATPase/GTPase